ncbi:fimbrial protein [Vibrio splendidus]|uniref:fimbrial protein n=1 Tax=Vibrio splendidus TaxID=29497 RepID=UPI002235FAC9|nr:hypothetical protein [Vibrio splendidus]MCW4438860.1 hypothetical protein [Vibrio splendidus]
MKHCYKFLALSTLLAFNASATNESGTINFVGSIHAGTCNVYIDVDAAGTTNANNTVTLPAVAQANITANGSTAASATAFKVVIESCSDADKSIAELALTGAFDTAGNGVVQAHKFGDPATQISNLGFQIKSDHDFDGSVDHVTDWTTVSLKETGLSFGHSSSTDSTYEFPLEVSYYYNGSTPGTDTSLPGMVQASVNYLVSYQ